MYPVGLQGSLTVESHRHPERVPRGGDLNYETISSGGRRFFWITKQDFRRKLVVTQQEHCLDVRIRLPLQACSLYACSLDPCACIDRTEFVDLEDKPDAGQSREALNVTHEQLVEG